MLHYIPRRELADRSTAFRLLLDYNPCYVLSALLMLGGLFALNDSLDWSPLPVGNVLILIATLNLYEMLLIGLAIFLYAYGLRRDAAVLLVIEAFFLVDAGFLNSEIVTQDLGVGIVTNLILLMLALVKVAVVFGALGLPIRSGPYVLCMFQLAVLMVMPGVFKSVSDSHDGALAALALYGFWWVVGAIVAMYGIFLRCVDFTDAPRIDRFGRHRIVVAALLLLGLISILAHLCTSNWVYNVRWYTANLAPVVLGMAVAVGAAPSSVLRCRRRMQIVLALPMAAIAMSVSFPSAMVFGPVHLTPLTPLRLALLGSAMAYLHGLCRFGLPIFAWIGACCIVIAAMGSSVASIVENLMILNRTAARATEAMTPSRPVHWGILSIFGSFAMLVVGLVLSLKKLRRIGF